VVLKELIIKADLHIHTTYSDGSGTPYEVIKYAIRKGLDVIAVTDHNTFRGALEALRILRGKKLSRPYIIIGNEVRTSVGDVIVLCDEALQELEGREGINIYVLYDIAKSNNCFTFPAHPYDISRVGIGDYIKVLKWDAIEIFNAMSNPLSNYMALKACEELNLPKLSNSDAHIPQLIGIAHNLILVNDLSYDSLINSLRRGLVRNVCRYPTISQSINRFSARFRRYLKSLKI